MHSRNVPAIGPRYWTAISIASVFGANTGDFLAHGLHLGHQRGLLPLALVMALVLLLERRSRSATEVYYWLAIVTLRTAATNLADLMTHDLELGYAAVVAGLAALLCALVASGTLASGRATRQGNVPDTNTLYWVTMLTAGTLGTALGDAVADELGWGVEVASVFLAGVLGAMLVLRGRLRNPGTASYWATIVAVRTARTTVGDLAADTIGLASSTGGTLALLVATLALWRRRRSLQQA